MAFIVVELIAEFDRELECTLHKAVRLIQYCETKEQAEAIVEACYSIEGYGKSFGIITPDQCGEWF